jgi:hypothetical protein
MVVNSETVGKCYLYTFGVNICQKLIWLIFLKYVLYNNNNTTYIWKTTIAKKNSKKYLGTKLFYLHPNLPKLF